MTDREFFCKRHQVEFPTFKRVLQAMPTDRLDYRPHERSPSALELVWTLFQESAGCTVMIDAIRRCGRTLAVSSPAGDGQRVLAVALSARRC